MLRRITACPVAATAGRRSQAAAVPFPRSQLRRCATSKAEAKASEQAGRAAGEEKAGSAAAASGGSAQAHRISHGPQRVDWRTHKDVVYKKGVPMKGSITKLPLSEQFLICLIFSVAGMGAVYGVRPQIRYLCDNGFLGLTPKAGWVDGPWLYRVLYLLIMFPCYSAILFATGSFFGRRVWFSFMIHKMWSRFLTKGGAKRLEYILDIQHY